MALISVTAGLPGGLVKAKVTDRPEPCQARMGAKEGGGAAGAGTEAMGSCGQAVGVGWLGGWN